MGVLVVFVALSTAILITGSSLYWIQNSLRAHVQNEFTRVLDNVSRDVDRWYVDALNDMKGLATSSSLGRIMNNVDPQYDLSNVTRKRLDKWIGRVHKDHANIKTLLIVNEMGNPVAAAGEKIPLANVSELAQLYKGKPSISGIVVVDTQGYQLVSHPITLGSGGTASGYTVSAIYDTTAVDRILEGEQVQAAGRIYLLDSGVNIVAPSINRRVIREFARALPPPGRNGADFDYYPDSSGTSMVGSIRHLPVIGGAIAIERSYSSVFDPVSKTLVGIFLSCALTILILGFMAWLISRTIMKPLDALSTAVIRMFNGMREELYQTKRVLKKEARVDRLTGLFNRRYFEEQMPILEKWSERMKSEMTLLVIDLDHFKSWNDTFGHDVGDAVLKITGRTLKRVTRDTDLVARIGGDEFLVLAPGTDLIGAATLAEKIRQAVPRAVERERDSVGVTREYQDKRGVKDPSLSIGVAAYTGDGEALMKWADQALYRAKEAGRDQVRVYRHGAREDVASTG